MVTSTLLAATSACKSHFTIKKKKKKKKKKNEKNWEIGRKADEREMKENLERQLQDSKGPPIFQLKEKLERGF